MDSDSSGLRVAVTGAAGFIGSAVVARIAHGHLGSIASLRLNDIKAFNRTGASVVVGSYADPYVRERLIKDGVDILFHLASLPGGTSERDPELGRRTNLDGSIALIDSAARYGKSVIVYTSSIAVFGKQNATVSDETILRPGGSYGTHKAMVELYLADLTRRGLIDARSVRPAGIVARPRSSFDGFATAWMSDLFYAAMERRAITIPASPTSQIWLQSIDTLADNIIHAASMPESALTPHRAWTLPATVVRVEEIVESLHRRTGHRLNVDYQGGSQNLPPLNADAASRLGFKCDGSVDDLVDVVISKIENE